MHRLKVQIDKSAFQIGGQRVDVDLSMCQSANCYSKKPGLYNHFGIDIHGWLIPYKYFEALTQIR